MKAKNKYTNALLAFLLCICFFPKSGFSIEKIPAQINASSTPGVSSGSLLQVTLGLLVVLGIIIGVAWMLRRYGRLQSAASGSLKILGGLSVGPRERVVLLQAGDTQLLVGVAPGRVQTLHVLDTPILPAEALPAVEDASADMQERLKSFAERLNTAIKQRKLP